MAQSNLTGKSMHQLFSEVEDSVKVLFLQDNAQGPKATIICSTQMSKQVKAMVITCAIPMQMWVVMGLFNFTTHLMINKG